MFNRANSCGIFRELIMILRTKIRKNK